MKANNVEETIKALANELAVLPDFASTREMKIWNAFADERLRRLGAAAASPQAPAPPQCKGCVSGSLESFEHGGCLTDKTLDKELGRWQQAIYELCRKHAIVPDCIDGGGTDSGDPLDFTLSEIGQVICQLENPQDYAESKRKCTCPKTQWTGSEPNDSTCELTEEEHAQLASPGASPWLERATEQARQIALNCYAAMNITPAQQEHIEHIARVVLTDLSRSLEGRGPKFQVGQRVHWQGQIGDCEGTILEITHPENSGYVLKLDIGDGAEMYHSESGVELVEGRGGELEMMRKVIAWANNSLYGSHGFFLSLNGGEPNEHHLDSAIEELKMRANKATGELDALRRERDDAKQDAESWKHHWKMYRDAWVRELGGWLVPKAHEIDSLVLTTRKRCVNPLLGYCCTPHWLGKPTIDKKALEQTSHPRENSCKDWKFGDSEPNPTRTAQLEAALRLAHEWSARFPLQGMKASDADLAAAKQVYDACEAALAALVAQEPKE